MSNVSELVIGVLARHTGLDPGEISLSMRVRDDLGLDSIDAAQLLLVLEQETGRWLDIGEDEEIGTVGDIVAIISGGVPK